MQKKKTPSGLSLRYKSAFILPLLFALPRIQKLDDLLLHLFGRVAAGKILSQGLVFDGHGVFLALFLLSHHIKGFFVADLSLLCQLFQLLRLRSGRCILSVLHGF